MSLADYYAERGALAIESACSGDDVVLSASDPGEYMRLAREAQALLLADFRQALELLLHVQEWDDGGWRAEAVEFLTKLPAGKSEAKVKGTTHQRTGSRAASPRGTPTTGGPSGKGGRANPGLGA